MNTTPAANSRKNGIVSAIGILVLLLGTATGSAYVMLAMAVVAMLLIGVIYRQKAKRIFGDDSRCDCSDYCCDGDLQTLVSFLKVRRGRNVAR